MASGYAGCVVRFGSDSSELRRRQQRDGHGDQGARLFAASDHDLDRRSALALVHPDGDEHSNRLALVIKNSEAHAHEETDAINYAYVDAARDREQHLRNEHRA